MILIHCHTKDTAAKYLEYPFEMVAVSAWLLGPWLTAQLRVNGQEGNTTARKCFQELMPRLEDAGIETVSEILDAGWPHAPCGCIAQARTVAEILRGYIEDSQNHRPPTDLGD